MRLLYFLGLSFTLIWTNQGLIPERRLIFAINLWNMTEEEIKYIPYLYAPVPKENIILFDSFGLTTEFIIVPSSNPDNYTTVRTLDLETYPEDYFMNYLKLYKKSCTEDSASYKVLLKALEIAPKSSDLLFFSNTKLKDEHLLRDVINLTIYKQIQITYISRNMRDDTLGQILPNTIEGWFLLILNNVKKSQKNVKLYKAMLDDCRSSKAPTSTPPPRNDNVAAFVYDMINPSESEISDIAQKMSEYYSKRTKPKSHTYLNSFPIAYSSSPDEPLLINPTSNYDPNDFRGMLPFNNATLQGNSTLKALQKVIQFVTPPYNKIVYFTNTEPKDKYELLLELVNTLHAKKAEVIFHVYGKSPSLVYRILARAWKYTDSTKYFK